MLSVTREMAKALYASRDPVALYYFHKAYGADPISIVIAARFFERLGIAERQGNSIAPTSIAKRWIFSHRQKFFGETNRPWVHRIPARVRAFEPYMPELGRIDRKFFVSLIDNPKGAS